MNTINKGSPEHTDTLLEFPCEFPIKIMGHKHANFAQNMCQLLQKFVSHDVDMNSTTERPSRTGKYISLTIVITAESKSQLDNIYQALYEHEDVSMTL
jgi:putative lipoic acid-binding regulatory protein